MSTVHQTFPTSGWSTTLGSSVFVALAPFMVLTTFPVLPPPEPEKVLFALFGEILRVSPKLTVPELLLILTAPMIEGKEHPSLHPRAPVDQVGSLNKCRMFFMRVSIVTHSFEPICKTEEAERKEVFTHFTWIKPLS